MDKYRQIRFVRICLFKWFVKFLVMENVIIFLIGTLIVGFLVYVLYRTIKETCVHNNICIDDQYKKDIIINDDTSVHIEFKVYKCSKCDNITTSVEMVTSKSF